MSTTPLSEALLDEVKRNVSLPPESELAGRSCLVRTSQTNRAFIKFCLYIEGRSDGVARNASPSSPFCLALPSFPMQHLARANPRSFFLPLPILPCFSIHHQLQPPLFLLLNLSPLKFIQPGGHLITPWLDDEYKRLSRNNAHKRCTRPDDVLMSIILRIIHPVYFAFCALLRPLVGIVSGFNGDPHAPSITPSHFPPLHCLSVLFSS